MDGLRSINKRRRAFRAQPMKASRRKFASGGLMANPYEDTYDKTVSAISKTPTMDDDTRTALSGDAVENTNLPRGGGYADGGLIDYEAKAAEEAEVDKSWGLPKYRRGGRTSPGKGDRQHPVGKALGKLGLRAGGLVGSPSTGWIGTAGGRFFGSGAPREPNFTDLAKLGSTATPGVAPPAAPTPAAATGDVAGLNPELGGQRRYTGDNPLWTRPQPGQLADYVQARRTGFKKGGQVKGLKGYQTGGELVPRPYQPNWTIPEAPPRPGLPVPHQPPPAIEGTAKRVPDVTDAEEVAKKSRARKLVDKGLRLGRAVGRASIPVVAGATAYQAATEGTTPTDVKVGDELVSRGVPNIGPLPTKLAGEVAGRFIEPGGKLDEARRSIAGGAVTAARRFGNIMGAPAELIPGVPKNLGDVAVGGAADVAADRPVGTTKFEPRTDDGRDALRPTSYETDAEAGARGAQVQQSRTDKMLGNFGLRAGTKGVEFDPEGSPGVKKYVDPKTGKTLYSNTDVDVKGMAPTKEMVADAQARAKADSERLTGLVAARAASGDPRDLEHARNLAVTPEQKMLIADAENTAGLRARAAAGGVRGQTAYMELQAKQAQLTEGLRGQRALQVAMLNRVPTPLEARADARAERADVRAGEAANRTAEQQRYERGIKETSDAFASQFAQDDKGKAEHAEFMKNYHATLPSLAALGGDPSRVTAGHRALFMALNDVKKNIDPSGLGSYMPGASPGSRNLLHYAPKKIEDGFWNKQIRTRSGQLKTFGELTGGRPDIAALYAALGAESGVDVGSN